MAKDQEREDKLLGAVMSYLINGKSSVTFKLLAKDLDFMERTTTWRNSWRTLIETKGFIAPIQAGASVFTGEHQMTEAGKTHASTPEYEEYLKELNFCPQTNQEHQERIKKRLSNDKAVKIFDLLLKYRPLSRKELSILLKCNDRQHVFSYALQDLNREELVEKESKGKYRLSDKAFLDPESDRPVPVEVDTKLFEEGAAFVESKKRAGKKKQNKEAEVEKQHDDAGNKTKTNSKKRKHEEVEE